MGRFAYLFVRCSMKLKTIINRTPAVLGLLFMLIITLVCVFFLLSGDSAAEGSATDKTIILAYLFMLFSAVVFIVAAHRLQLKAVYTLVGIFLLTLAFQLTFSLNVELAYGADFRHYYTTASYYAAEGFGDGQKYNATFSSTASYPAFLSIFMRIFGVGRMVPIMLNHVAVSGTCCLCYLYCRKIMSSTFALSAAMLIGVHPFVIIYSNTCSAELLFMATALTAFFIYACLPRLEKIWKKLLTMALAALLCGLSNNFRPLGTVMLVAILIQTAFYSDGQAKTKIMLCSVAIIVFAAIMPVNSAIVKHITAYDPPSSSYGWNLYVGASEDGSWNASDGEEFGEIFDALETPTEIQSFFAEKGIERYRSMGIGMLPHFLRKLSYWNASGHIANTAASQKEVSRFYSSESGGTYGAIASIVDIPVFILALLTMILLFYEAVRGRGSSLLTLAFFQLGIFMVLMVLEIAPRYTVASRIIFCILAIYGIHRIVTTCLRRLPWHSKNKK